MLETGGNAPVVSQFSLAADTSHGNRPGVSACASPETGERLYRQFIATLRGLGVAAETGRFGADMTVHLVNDPAGGNLDGAVAPHRPKSLRGDDLRKNQWLQRFGKEVPAAGIA